MESGPNKLLQSMAFGNGFAVSNTCPLDHEPDLLRVLDGGIAVMGAVFA